MKMLLIVDPSLGLAGSYLVKTILSAAAAEIGQILTENPAEADLVVVTGSRIPTDNTLNGKLVYLGDTEQALHAPKNFFQQAKADAKPYQIPATDISCDTKRIVAVTACPTGVAHTFMAAEAIETEAKKRGWWVKVETRGSVGAGNVITPEEVEKADLVLVVADIDVDLAKFAGKPMYRTSTGLALKKTAQEFDKALAEAKLFEPEGQKVKTDRREDNTGIYRHLLTGVSYMLPMVVAGGLCIALSFAFGITAFKESGTLAAALMQIGGSSAFALMVPVLAGYIAFSIADRPGLTPGLIGGMLATSTNAGFIGGIIAGFLAGYVAKLLNSKVKLPQSMAALKPILIIPLFASLITGLIMIYVIGKPVAGIMAGLTYWLSHMGTTNALLLGAILGGMMCADMGGAINKAAYAFGVGLLSSQTYAPMAAIMAAGMVPPLAMGVATLIARQKFDNVQRESGKAALVLGLCFISEGAIPFAVRDPIRVLPCCIVGGAVTGAISMAISAQLMAPHGGLFVLLIPGAITPILGYLMSIIVGTLLAGFIYALIKRPETTTTKP
ncbi:MULTISPECIES: PTS fructose transporter subunit IIBC [Photorhabdus]|uniref:PTS fructose transporter subunit IIBC n=1 Tax=Photorhabdus TaxID=29487 RepID=UPI0007B46A3A|nr:MULTISPECIES: PTS fructose transporter subunit IIBC [Photorhabdus]AWK41791.1 PTS fructose transporter subunit EIIBC [Photorhabdus laumondii subsp. laumondii]AXG42612.1 PTS fructose transporter subunit IIBC [Photorhabdus laumondii subsp. laumondii]MCC8388141.1 PTS fructose transporter subunit IIBC [Photorhabdus laumondii]MCZ1249464.1 PTS fructose transporter subunit IIBC [Photorhabdus laumondii subsp. laumondii]NDL18442.1 PTS fructose transporter subunit IIBC [Photorhabdus laumondii subsp. l